MKEAGDVREQEVPVAEKLGLAMDEIPEEIQPVVVSPDDEIEAYTKERKRTPRIRFVYRPLAGEEETNYLRKLEEARDRIHMIKKASYEMLAKHIVDADLIDRKRNRLDVSIPQNWARVPSEIIGDMTEIVSGTDNKIVEQDEKNIRGL